MMCAYNPITGFLFFTVILFWRLYWLGFQLVTLDSDNPVTDRILWYVEYNWFEQCPATGQRKDKCSSLR